MRDLNKDVWQIVSPLMKAGFYIDHVHKSSHRKVFDPDGKMRLVFSTHADKAFLKHLRGQVKKLLDGTVIK